jgi:hypothetical protein
MEADSIQTASQVSKSVYSNDSIIEANNSVQSNSDDNSDGRYTTTIATVQHDLSDGGSSVNSSRIKQKVSKLLE